MAKIVYKFTINAKMKYFNNKPFYVGQFVKNISKNDFLKSSGSSYWGSGKIWIKFCKGLKRKFPTCWYKLIKREILFYSENCPQAVLDTMEEYFIKKEKSHYSYQLGGCNILWGTANEFGSGSPMKDPMVVKKVTDKIRGRKGAKRSEEGRRNISIGAKKSWINAYERKQKVSFAISNYMKNGGAKKLSELRKGIIFSEERKKKISENHADFRGENHPLYGAKFKWINDGKINKRLNENQPLPTGFYYGKLKMKIK